MKILDFGLAKVIPTKKNTSAATFQDMPTFAGESTQLTQAGAAVGTISYMSPEQARGEELDVRSDLFALGAVIYEMASGRVAFDGDTSAVIYDCILNRTPIAPGQFNPEVFPKLEEIIFKLLDKDRQLRYQSASELEVDLKRLRRESDASRTAVRPPLTASSPAAGRARTRRSRKGISVGTLIVIVAGLFVLQKFRNSPAPPIQPPAASTAVERRRSRHPRTRPTNPDNPPQAPCPHQTESLKTNPHRLRRIYQLPNPGLSKARISETGRETLSWRGGEVQAAIS